MTHRHERSNFPRDAPPCRPLLGSFLAQPLTTTDVSSTSRVPETETLSRTQHLIWMGQRLHPRTPLYNMVLAFEIDGDLDVDRFERALQRLVDDSDALRSRVLEDENGPRLEVPATLAVDLDFVEASHLEDPDGHYRTWLQQRSQRVLSLDERCFDVALVRLDARPGQSKHVFYFNQHHIITDAWSTALCMERLAANYRQLGEKSPELDCELAPFADYVAFEIAQRTRPAHAKAVDHWTEKVATACPPTRFYGANVTQPTARTERVVHRLGTERSRRLAEFAQRTEARGLTREISQFHVFAATLFALARRIGGGHDELAMLAPVHGRPTSTFKRTIGPFLEVFPMHVHLPSNATFAELLRRTRTEYRDLLAHASPGTSTATQSRSHDILLNYIPSSFGTDFAGLPMQTEWVHPGHGDPAHSLRLQVHDFAESGEFELHFDFNCDVFGGAERGAAIRHFVALLDAMLDDCETPVDDVDLLTDDERTKRTVDYNATDVARDAVSVPMRIREMAERHPNAIALRCGESEISYAEMRDRVTEVAAALRTRSIGPGALVATLLPRSTDFIVAILAVLECGAAYLPLEPNFPDARLALLLEESGADLVLTHSTLENRVDARSRLAIDRDVEGHTPSIDTPFEADPRDRAYVIYTSGSTGRPKGVEILHGALQNYVEWASEQYVGTGDAKTFAFFSPVGVDLSVTSIFVPLLTGGTVDIYPVEDELHDLAVLRVFDEDRVDIVKLTPAHLSMLLERGKLETDRISTLIVGGEDLSTRTAQRVHDSLGDRVAIYNEYGPTEATVGCMIHQYDPDLDVGSSVPIGRPIANSKIYVLDDSMRPVPDGVPGEIWIGGAGLARGYLGDASATDASFVASPFEDGERLYKSGDLGRMDPVHDRLVYTGRIDDQVKIRGARVELAEVEATLSTHPSIANCVVDIAARTSTHEDSTADPRWVDVRYCERCGLASNHPDAHLDDAGICSVCHEYDGYRDSASRWFRSMDDLENLFAGVRERRQRDKFPPKHDCIMLLSGGKDSTYALYQLAEMGLDVLVLSLDNGYISDSAKANIRRVVDDLGLELVFAQTPSMNAIFADSLDRFSNVCQGCFKTIYTLSTQLAKERGIRHIVTGLSRGQIFETRLAGFFRSGVHDVEEIDRMIVDARKAYHRVDDTVARQLDVSFFETDDVFEEIQFVDFYRYCDAPLEDVLHFIQTKAAWIRPADTGRSTNCLINDTGIYVHKRERGFHNYALPYSWDVRLGHKTRDECLDELDDEIDETKVHRTLQEVGATLRDPTESTENRLVAYVVPSNGSVESSALRRYLAERLPPYMLPSSIVEVAEIPLTASGKVDRAALPDPSEASLGARRDTTAPRTKHEAKLVAIWKSVLGLEAVGIHENFLDLGGDSILNIQIVSRARSAGLELTPGQVFAHPTIAELADVARLATIADFDVVHGAVPLTPMQRWFFDTHATKPEHCGQTYTLEVDVVDRPALDRALATVCTHHDALRARFEPSDASPGECGWTQSIPEPDESSRVRIDEPTGDDVASWTCRVGRELHAAMDLARGALVLVGIGRRSDGPDRIVLAIHHLVVDAVSWTPILEDLDTAYRAAMQDETAVLPGKTTSWQAWARHLEASARSRLVRDAQGFWAREPGRIARLPLDLETTEDRGDRASARVHSAALTEAETSRALEQRARLDEMLVAAIAHTLGVRDSAATEARIDIEGHGRDPIGDAGLDTSRTVGWFTSLFPLSIGLDESSSAVLANTRASLERAPHDGKSFGLLRYGPDASTRGALAKLPPSEVLFNYLGRAHHSADDAATLRISGPLTLSHAAESRRTHSLEIWAEVADGALTMHVGYSATRHRAGVIRTFADDVLATIRGYLEGDVQASPSDFPHAQLSQSDLDDLLEEFGDD